MIEVHYTPQFSPQYMTARYRQRMQALTTGIFRAERESAQAMRKTAIRLSSGPFSTAWLQAAARQRPGRRGLYSKADPAPPLPAFMINNQSKGFDSLRAHWQTRVMARPDGTALTLWNSSGHAKYLFLGTRTSISRPILQEVQRLEGEARRQRLIEAKTRALLK